jgi:hypothetical protein
MTDGADDSDLIIPAQPEQLEEADVVSLDSYSEEDDVVTQQVEAMLLEPRWLVQFTSLDRRLMDTSELITALLGGSIRRETLVWRGGMEDWIPVGRLDLLAPSAIPTLPPQRRDAPITPRISRRTTAAPAIGAKPLELTLAALAIALSAATITTSILSIAGVFDAHGSATRVQALRAGVPAPDAERATAVVH